MAAPFAPEKTPLGNPPDPRNDIAAGNPSDPRSLSGDEIEDKEAGAKPGASMDIGKDEKNAIPSIGGRGEKTKAGDRIRGRLRLTRRKSVAMIVAGTIGFGGFGAFSIIQAPLQLMHLSQALQKPLAQQEEDSEPRIKGLLRFARTGDFGQTRIGYFGSRSAAKTEQRLKNIGIEIAAKDNLGRATVFEIDVQKHGGQEKALQTAQKYVDKGLPSGSIETVKRGNRLWKIRVVAGTNAAHIRNIELTSLDIVHENKWKPIRKATVALQGRAVAIRDGGLAPWHLWKKAELKAMSRALAIDNLRDKDKKRRSTKALERIENIKQKVDPRVAGAAATAAGVQIGVCTIKEIAHSVPLLNYDNVVRPAQNDAIDGITGGEQIKAMDDFHISQPGGTASTFSDPNEHTIWQSQALDGLVNNDAGSGADLDQTTKDSFSHKSPEAEVDSAIIHLGGNHICSPEGYAAGLALGGIAIALAAPTGGLSVLATYGAFQVGQGVAFGVALSAITQVAINNLKDEPLQERFDDAPFAGSIKAYGAESLAGNFYIHAGGANLGTNATTAPTVGQLKEQEEFNQRNFFARTFDIYDYRSVASRTVDKINPSPGNSLQHVASLLFKPQLWLSGLLSSLNHQVSAANTHDAYDFGFPKYGFRQSELTNPLFEDPYDNADKAASILQAHPEWKERALKCFGVELTQGVHGLEVNVADNPDGDAEKAVIPSTGDYISADCAEGNTDWLRVRLFIFDSRTMEAYACYDDDDEACQAIGIDPGTSTASSSNSVTDDDAKELAKQILENSNATYPYVDSAGDTAKKVLESIRDTGKAFTNSSDQLAVENRKVSVNPKMLQAILEYIKDHKLAINALTNADHSAGSNHYTGEAVDFDCSIALDRTAWEQVASKYGGKNNGEVCPGDEHWHYDFLKK